VDNAVKYRRLSFHERRQQIIDAVLEVVSTHGIPGTTVARVAEAANIGVGTLYRYFAGQKEMLIAAVETLSEHQTATILDMKTDNALEHIREMAGQRTVTASSEKGKLARLWLEFTTANPEVGLLDTVIETQRSAFRAVQEVCELGVRQGSIRADADVVLLTYLILQQSWGADLSNLIGMKGFLGRDCPSEVLEMVLRDAAARPET
jgi:AcrR family transcriptional regulator